MDIVISLFCMALAGINLPSVILSAREASRNRTCQYNIRMLGQGLQTYHEMARTLPPAAFWSADGLDFSQFFWDKEKPRTPEVSQANWLQLLLPTLGHSTESALFTADAPIVRKCNAKGRELDIAQFKCPSDALNGSNNHFELALSNGATASFARGNYGINGGSQWIFKSPGVLFNPRPNASHFAYDPITRDFQFWGNGVAGFNKCFSFADLDNGLATTVAIDEIRAGVSPMDTRGSWALGQIGASVTWGHGIVGDAGAPNNLIDDSDDIIDCKRLHEIYGSDKLKQQEMPCCAHCNQNQQAAARSRHKRGVNVVMMDGAVRFVSNDVDRGLWDAMHSRETPATEFGDGFSRAIDGHDPAFRQEASAPISKSESDAQQTKTEILNSMGMTFVLIPAGEFEMGVPNQGIPLPPQAPSHHVKIPQAYYLGKYEVTQIEYANIMGQHPSWHSAMGEGRTLMESIDTSQHPVEQISWYEAVEFCRRLTERDAEKEAHRQYRLPTEAEWEYACRAGRRGAIPLYEFWNDSDPSGEIASKRLREDGKIMTTTHVGSYPSNAFGICDMCGNVFEWCSDWYGFDYYSSSPKINPQGPNKGYFRIIRGWYWAFTGPSRKDIQATAPSRRSPYIGFRIVCEHTK